LLKGLLYLNKGSDGGRFHETAHITATESVQKHFQHVPQLIDGRC
jgi:hypothetical protein